MHSTLTPDPEKHAGGSMLFLGLRIEPHVGAALSTVAPLSLLVPVIGLLSAMFLLGETPTGVQWLGTLGVLLGMLMHQLGGRWWRRAQA